MNIAVSIAGENIETTTNHPFWVVGKGWTKAGDLNLCDEVITFSGETLEVENISIVAGQTPVYNFEVAGTHTYYVSGAGVLVHNQCNLPESPVGKLAKMDENYWKKKGFKFHLVKDADSRFDLYLDKAK